MGGLLRAIVTVFSTGFVSPLLSSRQIILSLTLVVFVFFTAGWFVTSGQFPNNVTFQASNFIANARATDVYDTILW